LDLPGFLIMPVQRLPRYGLLLRDLIKYTDSKHPDYLKLIEAERLVKDATHHINEQKRERDNINEVNDIKNQLTGKMAKQLITNPQMKVLRKGEVKASTPGDFMILLNDTILIVKQKKDTKKLKDILNLQNAIITYGVEESHTNGAENKESTCLKIITPQKEIILEFGASDTALSWKKEIQKAIAALDDKRRALLSSRINSYTRIPQPESALSVYASVK